MPPAVRDHGRRSRSPRLHQRLGSLGFDDLIGADTIARVEEVKTGLKELLALLDSGREPKAEAADSPARRVRKRKAKK